MMETNHFNRAALHWRSKCRPIGSEWYTGVKGDRNQKKLSSVSEEALDHQHGFRQPEPPGLGQALSAQGPADAGIQILKLLLHNWPLSGTRKAMDQRCFWLPLLCSAPECLVFIAVFLAYSFFSHLTLTEICFDYWEKGSKLKQMHGD